MLRSINFLCRCWSRRADDEDAHEFLMEKNYEIVEVIGKGRLGVVHKCIDRTTEEQFACKKMPATENALNEMNIFQTRLPGRHPGILKPIAHYLQETVRTYGSSKDAYMVSELCDGGNLQRFIDSYGGVPERLAARIIQSLVQSLQYCHSCKIIHRDVKPSSIFILNTGSNAHPCTWVFKLGNFDRSIWNGPKNAVIKMDNVGTLVYSAPEMLGGTGYSYEVDIWSAGAVLYRLLFGRTPFYAVDDAALMYEQIQNTEPKLSDPFLPSISESAKELVLGMLQKDRTRRFSCDEILNHPWILDNVKLDVGSSSTINTEIVSTSGKDDED